MAFISGAFSTRVAAKRQAKCAPVRMSGDFVANPDEANAPMKTIQEVEAGKTFPVCRCWQSKNMPMCDGSHNAHNKETGDKLGPLVIKVPKAE